MREFGTIYEGLLESSLSIAETDLTTDDSGAWVPAQEGDTVEAPAGTVYFHSASGERKATGSYFTPKIVVDHLIERSITPTLNAHLAKVADLLVHGEAARAERLFFDFRVADLAMGSGHFLVAAVDKVEALMRNFLTKHTLPGVESELLRLAGTAKDALGDDEEAKTEIDNIALLRRQVARRCIYGIDVNPLAVELARLALWIHTFVPGLPMSNLDHGLVCANSLTGIGTIEEAVDALVQGADSEKKKPGKSRSAKKNPAQWSNLDKSRTDDIALFAAEADAAPQDTGYQRRIREIINSYLSEAVPLLRELAAADEADKAGVTQSRELLEQVRKKTEPVRRIMNAAVATRIDAWSVKSAEIVNREHIQRIINATEPDEVADQLQPAHLPYLFPEVFLRDNPGFDVLVGNPPWEELMVEEPKFWLRIRPGLLGLPPKKLEAEIERLRQERADLLPALERETEKVAAMRRVLLAGPYPGLGTGDIDLYQAFAWRFWQLLRTGGSLGVVMPRSILNSAGGAEWRRVALAESRSELVTLTNTAEWVFCGIDGRYSIGLVAIKKLSAKVGTIRLSGPFYNQDDFLAGRDRPGTISFETLAKASTGAAVPNLPDAESVVVFTQIRKAPRLDGKRPGWDFRPVREFDATNDRKTFDAGEGSGRIPVIGGAGFNLWEPQTGEVYAWADPNTVEDALFAKRQRQTRMANSAFAGLPADVVANRVTLPFHHPRIAFRDVTNATNTRTCIAALVPPETILTNKAPYLLTRGETQPQAEAFLLGALSSIPLDWYARRYVEIGMNLHIFNGLPVPVYDPDDTRCQRICEIAGCLAAVDDRYADWAAAVEVPVGSVRDQAEKDDLIAELDALVSLLYGLSEDQVEHIFATFHRGWDYAPRLAAVLTHFHAWRNKHR
ncbi:MAG: hypothetical protein FWE94_07715 [Coriobacteriia bacterium]|nr:hypothetical protein [Coriobacteriia bacterium]